MRDVDIEPAPVLPHRQVLGSPGATLPAAVAGVLLVLAAASAAWFTLRNQDEAGWVKHTLQVENGLTRVLSLLQDAETGQRGYLLTGDDTYLQPFQVSGPRIEARLAEVAGLTRDNPDQQATIAGLRPLVAAKLDELGRTIDLRRAGRVDDALAEVRTNQGRDLMDQIRAGLRTMIAAEERLLQRREADAARSSNLLLASVGAALLFAIVFAALWARGVARVARLLRTANEQLEARVQERTYELAASQAEFRTLAETMPSLMFVTDAAGANTYTNPQFQAYAGMTADDLLGDGWLPVIHPDDVAQTAAAWNVSVLSGEAYEIEYRFRRHDGTYRWFLGRGTPVRNGGEGIQRWVGTCTDIDDRKRAEDSLAGANAELEARVAERSRELDRMFRLSLDMLVVAGFDARFRSVSPAWERITGRPLEEALTRSAFDFIHPDDRAATEAVHGRLTRGEPAVGFENRYKRADGSYCRLAWRAVSIPDEKLIYAVARDVTDEHDRDERLRQSQKMEVVGQLTGGIAHDFNNLLTIVIGSVEMLQRGLREEDTKLRRRADTAMEGAKRAAALTHRLLAFSRRQPLEPKVVEPNRLVSGMSELLQRTLGEQVAIETVLAAGLWRTQADPNQLENALLNLAVNARDAMPAGGKLTIETANIHLDEAYAEARSEVAAGQYVMFAVTDTGSGMTPDTMARVFEPFFTTKPVGQGTGLGLAQVYGFVKQSGGHVAIYSEVGEGTAVKLYLPRLRGAVRPDAEVAPEQTNDMERSRGETILVVEDEAAVRAFTVEVLEDLGYRVLAAEDAEAGLMLLEGAPEVDLLLTDVVLAGGVNGRQLADEAVRRRPALRVLFMTGYTRNAIIHNGRLDEGVQLISKPFTVASLGRKARQVMDKP
jgi:PAS domain S-box-containing protein